MPLFYALVDAMPGRDADVDMALRAREAITGVVSTGDASADFLIRFEVDDFDVVDDFLQTHVRTIPGVSGVEIIQDWDDYSALVHDARAKLA